MNIYINFNLTKLSIIFKISIHSSENHFQYLEALIYAINSVNTDNSVLRNVVLGGLGLDDCSSTILARSAISQVKQNPSSLVEKLL